MICKFGGSDALATDLLHVMVPPRSAVRPVRPQGLTRERNMSDNRASYLEAAIRSAIERLRVLSLSSGVPEADLIADELLSALGK